MQAVIYSDFFDFFDFDELDELDDFDLEDFDDFLCERFFEHFFFGLTCSRQTSPLMPTTLGIRAFNWTRRLWILVRHATRSK